MEKRRGLGVRSIFGGKARRLEGHKDNVAQHAVNAEADMSVGRNGDFGDLGGHRCPGPTHTHKYFVQLHQARQEGSTACCVVDAALLIRQHVGKRTGGASARAPTRCGAHNMCL
jgi:hypothetical protein